MSRRRYLSTDAGRDKAVRDLALQEPHAATFYLMAIPAAADDATLPTSDPEELMGDVWPLMARHFSPEDVTRWVALIVEYGLWEVTESGALRFPPENWGVITGAGVFRDTGTARYRAWRNAVLERDGFTCNDCGTDAPSLHAHHIQSWAAYPDLRFDVTNGCALCALCHRAVHARQRGHS